MKNRICIVLPYYGTIPVYFPLYLQTLQGRRFDLLFVSDLTVEKCPKNFHALRLSFDELRARIVDALRIDVKLTSPRKLCDFRPFYGKIFERELKEYDYWGYGDCDVIYGKMMDEILDRIVADKYDFASFRRGWASGGYSLVRNSDRMRSLYHEIDCWKRVAQTEENQCFDECRVWWRFRDLDRGTYTVEDCRKVGGDSWTAVLWRSDELKIFHRNLILESGLRFGTVALDKDGRLFAGRTEIPIFHYVSVKSKRTFAFDGCEKYLGERLYIDDCGFYRGGRFLRPFVRACRKTWAVGCDMREKGFSYIKARLQAVFRRVCESF